MPAGGVSFPAATPWKHAFAADAANDTRRGSCAMASMLRKQLKRMKTSEHGEATKLRNGTGETS